MSIDTITLAERTRLALQYSLNHARLGPPLCDALAAQHIEGLCRLVQDLVAALPVASEQPAAQEPAAWLVTYLRGDAEAIWSVYLDKPNVRLIHASLPGSKAVPLYTRPAEPAAVPDRPFVDVQKLRRALSQLGLAAPESDEQLSAKASNWIDDVFDAVLAAREGQ